MSRPDRFIARAIALAGFAFAPAAATAGAQANMAPINSAPNPYTTVVDWAKMPEGRTWGSSSAVDIDRDGKSIWVAERCGTNNCATSTLDPVLKFDSNGTLVAHFGAGLILSPHAITVDKDNNIWVVDCACTLGGGGRGRGGAGRGADSAGAGRAAAPPSPAADATKGHQIHKFSSDGKLLMTLGKAGVAGSGPDEFNAPSAVLVAPNGDIFVADGHGGNTNARIVKFTKDGKFIKSWGKKGSGPGELDIPHALAMDSRGRLFVGDRQNNRIQIFDQDGNYIDQWFQFSRPSGVFIDKKDIIYVADSESESVAKNHDGWKRGIRVGRVRDGVVTAFIPDPVEKTTGTSAAEGVAADANGNIYGAEVGPKRLMKYSKN